MIQVVMLECNQAVMICSTSTEIVGKHSLLGDMCVNDNYIIWLKMTDCHIIFRKYVSERKRRWL